jgi:two-component system response regulator YesN
LEKTNQFSAELNLTKLELLKTITTSTNANELLENYHEGILQVQQMVAMESDSESLLLKKISLYIYEHSNQDLSLKKVAEHFHYNYSYLSNLFSKQKQISYTEYVTTMRIEKSKELLRKGKMNISEIADMVGYADVSYFSKVFKKMTGSTPSEYMRGKQT